MYDVNHKTFKNIQTLLGHKNSIWTLAQLFTTHRFLVLKIKHSKLYKKIAKTEEIQINIYINKVLPNKTSLD